jgi:hypothetical protein
MGGRTLLSSHGKRTAIQTSIVKHFLRLNNQRQMLIKLQMQDTSRILHAHALPVYSLTLLAYAPLLARLGGAMYFDHPESFGSINKLIRTHPQYIYVRGNGIKYLIQEATLDKVNLALPGPPATGVQQCIMVYPTVVLILYITNRNNSTINYKLGTVNTSLGSTRGCTLTTMN